MRILNISAQKPDSTGSGIFLTETVKALESQGHECAVIAGVTACDSVNLPPTVKFYPVLYNSASLPFPVCGMSDEMPYESTRYSELTPEMTDSFRKAFSEAVLNACKEFQPHVILCHHLYLLTALVRRLCPDCRIIGICHGSDLRQYASNLLFREEIRSGVNSLDKICCLHDEQKKLIVNTFGTDSSKISVTGSGFSKEIFYDRKLRTDSDRHKLLFAGKISEKKGVYSLLRAMEHLPDDYTLSLAGGFGSDRQKEDFEKTISPFDCRVKLLGKLSQDRLAEEYSSHGIFVLPSFYEGLPLVLAEALACGMKAVCSDLPGIKVWMNRNIPGNGIMFVKPPDFISGDCPIESSLPDFEKRLADAIIEADLFQSLPPDTDSLSWDGVAERILA